MQKIERFAPPPEGLAQGLPPLSDSDLLHLSHYQIDDYLNCPLKYKYVHVLRLPFFHHTIVYGKAVHAAVELYYHYKISGQPVTLDMLYQSYSDAWRNIGFLSQEHEERRFDAGKDAIRKFFEREEKIGQIPDMIEEKFNFRIGMNQLAGRWDRIDNRNGNIVIVDFKTSEVYQQDAADKKTSSSLQLQIYSMAYEQNFGHYPDWVELHFLESGLIGKAEINKKNFDKARDQIETAARGIRIRDYTAAPNYQSCAYCAYSNICPSAAV
jgi:CRISPR/Cas system-associated exonuclease Cas4 (RecB family)